MSENDFTELDDELSPAESAAIVDWLSRPEMWDDPDPELEDAVLAAIVIKAGTEADIPGSEPAPVTAPVRRSRRRRGGGGFLTLAAVAAAVVLFAVVAVGMVRTAADRSGEVVLALRPPAGPAPLAPDAGGEAHVDERGDGTRIRLDVRGLPPAPAGTYYEAWMRKNPQIGVSAGTFHLREGGRETIELWSGVTPGDYPLFTITIQDEARPESSGRVLLSGRLG